MRTRPTLMRLSTRWRSSCLRLTAVMRKTDFPNLLSFGKCVEQCLGSKRGKWRHVSFSHEILQACHEVPEWEDWLQTINHACSMYFETPQSWHVVHTVVLQKQKRPKQFGQFRPVDFANTTMKLYRKMIWNRAPSNNVLPRTSPVPAGTINATTLYRHTNLWHRGRGYSIGCTFRFSLV